MGNLYVKKNPPVVAMQWTGDESVISNFCRFVRFYENIAGGKICCIDKAKSCKRAKIGDWLVTTGEEDSIESWIVVPKEEFEKSYIPASAC